MEWQSVWDWLKDEQHRNILTWFGGAGSALTVAGWTLFVYARKRKKNGGAGTNLPGQKAGGDIKQKAGWDITHGNQEAGGDIVQDSGGDITYTLKGR